jgi:hypothetical protein
LNLLQRKKQPKIVQSKNPPLGNYTIFFNKKRFFSGFFV